MRRIVGELHVPLQHGVSTATTTKKIKNKSVFRGRYNAAVEVTRASRVKNRTLQLFPVEAAAAAAAPPQDRPRSVHASTLDKAI